MSLLVAAVKFTCLSPAECESLGEETRSGPRGSGAVIGHFHTSIWGLDALRLYEKLLGWEIWGGGFTCLFPVW